MKHIKISQKLSLHLLVALLLATILFGGSNVYAVDEGFDVPSGVPTEAAPDPIELSVPDTTLTVNGCAAPNAFVTLLEDNQPIGTVIGGANGRFSKTVVGQDHGIHTIKAFYEDSAGRSSAAISENINLAPHANTNLPLFLAPTVETSLETLFVGDIIVFRGTTYPQATVNVTIDGNTTVVATANSLGNWLVSVDTEDFFIGTHIYSVVAAHSACGTSEISDPQGFRLTRPSAQELIDSNTPETLEAPIITSPTDGFLASNPGVLINGQALANAQLEILVDGVVAGSIFANARGEWSFPFTMTALEHEIQVRMCIDGQCSLLSNSVNLQFRGEQLDSSFDRLDGCSVHFRLEQYRFFGLKQGTGIDIELTELTGTGQYEMLIDWGDTTIENFTLYRDNETRFHHVFNETGQFNGVITIADANDCIHTQYISIDVLDDREFNYWWLFILAIPPAMVIVYRLSKHLYRIQVRSI